MMAPRGRPRKLSPRAEAAIEHMSTMGFDHDNICRELKKLLKTYGEDQWLFIEGDSYKVLIEALLDSAEPGAQPENGNGNQNGNFLEAADAGLSNPHLQPSSSTVMEANAQHNEPEDIQAERHGMRGLSIHDNAPTNNFSPPSLVAPPHVRRRPCYGWIVHDDDDDDDDEEAEIIVLPSEISAFDPTKEREHELKRKTRWDVAHGLM